MSKTPASRVTSRAAAALFVTLGLASLSAPPASAQLGGSLIVTITSPTSGSTVGSTIPVNANVTIVGGLTVMGVQFKVDGVNIGAEDTAPPYSVQWNTSTASNGSHTLTAVARDLLGIRWTSNPVTVTVFNDTTPPTVAITSPSSGATLRGTTAVSANASDNVGVVGVQFRLDGNNLGAEDTASPYGLSWDTTAASNGTHALTAVARDAAGNSTTSVSITITVDNSAPTVALTTPAAGAMVGGTTAVTASASDNVGVAGVRFFVDGAAIGVEDTGAPYSVAWNTATVTNGAHALTAVARDAAGNTTTSGAITVTVDNSAPTVALTAPSAGAALKGTTTVTASAADNVGVAGVRFFVDGAAIGAEDTVAPYSATWNTTTVANGSHTLTAVARDGVGNTTTSSGITVTVDNSAPTVAVTAPSAGATVAGTTTVTASASDNVGVAGVQFLVDGAAIGAEDTVAPYSATWDTTTTANGSHTLTAVARDGVGNTTTSSGVTVTVGNIVLTVALTAPTGGTTVAGTTAVTAAASTNAVGVQFLVDNVAIGTEDTTAPYSVAWDTTPIASGSHTLTAVARDGAGNTTTSAPVTVIVSQTATRFENTDLAITYTDGVLAPGQPPAWFHGSRSRDWSGRLASFNRSQGARATFHFQGTTVRWIGFLAPWAGIARVYVDDVFIAELDLYATTEQPQSVVFSRTGLSIGPHTLTVESTGRKNPASTDYAVVVDAFDVAPAMPHPAIGARTEESGLSLSAGWSAAEATTRAWSGGTAIVSATTGAQATFTFVGTEVRWVGLRGPQMGIAQVYLDGAFHARVDAYDANESEEVTFVITGLAAGTHTLTIGPTGDKRAAATGANVVIDALDVRGRVEDQDPSIAWTNGWLRGNGSRDWSGSAPNTAGGTGALTRTAGEQATISFKGTGVSWIGLRGPTYGIARVLVDGVLAATVDTYAPTEEVQAVVYTATGLSDGAHTLTVEVTGSRNPSSIDALIVVDAFDVTLPASAPAVARFQESHSAAAYSGTWNQLGGFRYFTGESVAYSTTAGASVTFSFTGTAVRWIGYRTFYGGIARVLLDGVEVAQVDTFAPVEEEFQAVMYAATGLPGTSHTLTIENTGLKNPAAQNTWVTVDAFDVY